MWLTARYSYLCGFVMFLWRSHSKHMDSHIYRSCFTFWCRCNTHTWALSLLLFGYLFDILTDDLLLKPLQPCTGLFWNKGIIWVNFYGWFIELCHLLRYLWIFTGGSLAIVFCFEPKATNKDHHAVFMWLCYWIKAWNYLHQKTPLSHSTRITSVHSPWRYHHSEVY